MALVDEIKLYIKSGKGGDGVVRWRREKSRPMGGPGGGNGGRGGDVYIVPIRDVGYLDFYRHTKSFTAENGNPGEGLGKQGAEGEDLILKFPIGSVITNKDTGETFELLHDDDKILILKGGRGGLGNEHYKSSRNVAPEESTPGAAGEDGNFHIELRLFADVGLIGLPSAGKSTLLNALTNAKSKVAEYHFTTLDPHLGSFHGFVLADIPGLIEGASEGKGLGTKFLRHIKRTKMLAHVLSLESDDLVRDYEVIRKELAAHDQELATKDEIIILSKTDVITPEELRTKRSAFDKKIKHKTIIPVSAYDEESIKALGDTLVKLLRAE